MNSQQLDYGTILIVDDNPANLDVLSDFLDSSGFEVLVAQDGTSAIDKVNYAPPHLILLDIMMPPQSQSPNSGDSRYLYQCFGGYGG